MFVAFIALSIFWKVNQWSVVQVSGETEFHAFPLMPGREPGERAVLFEE